MNRDSSDSISNNFSSNKIYQRISDEINQIEDNSINL